MAKVLSSKIKKTREKSQPRATKAQVNVINKQAVGDEPMWKEGQTPTSLEKAYAFNWYSVCAEMDQAREWLIGYVVKFDIGLSKLLALVSNSSFPRTPSWLARMSAMGADVSSSHNFIMQAVKEVTDKYAVQPTESDGPKVMPADAKCGAFIANLEDTLDKGDWTFNVYDALRANNFPTTKVGAIIDYYAPLLDETRVAIANTDTQVYEGYRRIAKKKLQAQETWLSTAIDDCKKYSKSEKAVRAPRKKVAQSAEKKLKHFVWMKTAPAYKAASVDPSTIVGAKKVYLFNVKYKAVTVLNGDSLDIKGKSIIGFNDSSYSQPMGRQAEAAVAAITTGTDAAVVRQLDEIRKGKNPWPRVKNLVDANTLVLRVVSR